MMIQDILINMWQSKPALWNSRPNLLIYKQCQRTRGSIGTNRQPSEFRNWYVSKIFDHLDASLSAMLSQHYVIHHVNVVTTSRLPERTVALVVHTLVTCMHTSGAPALPANFAFILSLTVLMLSVSVVSYNITLM